MENLLLRIEEYFVGKKPNEVKLYLLVVFVIAAYLPYLAFYDSSEQYLQMHLDTRAELEKTYNETEKPADVQNKIARQTELLKKETATLNKVRENNNFLNDEFGKLSANFFNTDGQNLFLNFAAQTAKENNINVIDVVNNTNPLMPIGLNKIYDFRVSFESKFMDLLKYISTLEQLNLVVDINNMDINASKGGVSGSMDIAAWGVKHE